MHYKLLIVSPKVLSKQAIDDIMMLNRKKWDWYYILNSNYIAIDEWGMEIIKEAPLSFKMTNIWKFFDISKMYNTETGIWTDWYTMTEAEGLPNHLYFSIVDYRE